MKQSSSKSQDIQTNIQQYPTVADLIVQPKIEKTITWKYTFFNFGPSLELRKGNLIADIVKEHHADILLEPQVTYIKVPFGQRKLTITGFPASFKDFRKASQTDLKAIQAAGTRNGCVSSKDEQTNNKESEMGFMKKIISKFK